MTAKRTESKPPRSARDASPQSDAAQDRSALSETRTNGSGEQPDDLRRQLDSLRRRFEELCGVLPGIFFEARSSGDASSVRVDFLGPGARSFLESSRRLSSTGRVCCGTSSTPTIAPGWLPALGAGLPKSSCEFEFRMTLPCEDGTKQTRWVRLVVASTDSNPSAYRGLVEDIRLAKWREESIRSSERQFRQLAENIKEMFWVSEVLAAEHTLRQSLPTAISGDARAKVFTRMRIRSSKASIPTTGSASKSRCPPPG